MSLLRLAFEGIHLLCICLYMIDIQHNFKINSNYGQKFSVTAGLHISSCITVWLIKQPAMHVFSDFTLETPTDITEILLPLY